MPTRSFFFKYLTLPRYRDGCRKDSQSMLFLTIRNPEVVVVVMVLEGVMVDLEEEMRSPILTNRQGLKPADAREPRLWRDLAWLLAFLCTLCQIFIESTLDWIWQMVVFSLGWPSECLLSSILTPLWLKMCYCFHVNIKKLVLELTNGEI